MPRARRSTATSDEGRFLTSRIRLAKRQGATNAEIGRAFGINERTVRKIASGETTGKRTYRRLVEPSLAAPSGQNLSIIRVDIMLSNGEIRTVNARVPTVRTRSGKLVAATPADIFRIPKLNSLIVAEMARLDRQYGGVPVEMGDAQATRAHVMSFRPITYRKAPLRIEITGTG